VGEAVGARAALSVAQAAEDRAAVARAGRDLRYWSSRRATAQVVEPPADADRVHFGSTVTIERDDGRRQTFRIVGEDEADPSRGLISYVSPMARALTDKGCGDEVRVAESEVEIVDIA
jgi:transcription elongation GreA/GreB family factor